MWVLIGVLLKIVIVTNVLLGAVAYLIYVERKIAAYAQDRIGPNRAGREFGIPFGLLQPLADGAKMLLKEGVVPGYVNKPLYLLAPMIAIVAALMAFAVIPFGPVGPGPVDRFPDRARRSTSASFTSSPWAAWRFTASSWPAGRRTTNIHLSAACDRVPS